MEVSSPCVYNCSLVLKTENRSLSKTINVSIHWKIRLSDGGFHKKTIKTRDCLKRKAWAVIRFKVGLVKKKGGVWFLRGAWYNNACYISWPNWKGREGGFKKGATLWDYPQEHVIIIREEKISPFGKFEIILHLLCVLLHLLTDSLCRTWSSMINLWIDSRTYQK